MRMKPFGLTSPIKIGIPYEIYKPMVAILVAAENATVEPTLGTASKNARNAASQIVRIGLRHFLSTLWKKCRNTSITSEAKHHARIAGHAEKATVPNTNNNECHHNRRAGLAKDINQDLKNGLAILTVDRPLKILNAEEIRKNEEPAKRSTAADTHQHTQMAQTCWHFASLLLNAPMHRIP